MGTLTSSYLSDSTSAAFSDAQSTDTSSPNPRILAIVSRLSLNTEQCKNGNDSHRHG